jgi:hypothetical protein
MMEIAGHGAEARVSVFPVAVREEVPALLYVWGAVQTAAVELLGQVAAGAWASIEAPPEAVPELVQIAAAPAPEQPRRKSWDELAPAEQEVHLRAQRFARVRASEIRLERGHAVLAGRNYRDVYGALRPAIDAAREEFRSKFFAASPSMVDYLHLELLRVLANDDAELLGKDYPGPLV